MKKGITACLATMLTFSAIPAAFAAPNSMSAMQVTVANNTNEEEVIEKPVITALSLQDALKYGMENDFSLVELDYALQELRFTEDVVDENFDDAEDNLDALQAAYNALNEKVEADKAAQQNVTSPDAAGVTVDNYEGKISSLADILKNLDLAQLQALINDSASAGDPNIILESLLKNIEKFLGEYKILEQSDEEKLAAMREQLYQLTQAYEQLDASLDQVELNINATYNNQRIMYQAMQVSIASQFLNLVKTEEQLALLKANYENEQRNLKATQTKFDLGMVSQKALNKATREFNDLSKDIEVLEKSLNNSKAAFALTIGVKYEGDYELVKPTMEQQELLKQEQSTEELIDKSLNIASAEFQLLIAEDNFDYIDEKDDATRDEKKKANLAIEKAQFNIEKTKTNLDKAIQTTFFQVEAQYKAVQDATQALQVAKDEVEDVEIYYNLGMISKLQYEASSLMVKQAEMAYDNARYDYYLLQRKVEAMYNGVIITQ